MGLLRAKFGEEANKLIFEFKINYEFKKESRLKKIGTYPPSIIRITFSKGRDFNDITLDSLSIKDVYGRKMLRRKIQKSGYYNIEFCGDLKKEYDNAYNLLLKQKPKQFLFDPHDIFHIILKVQRDKYMHKKSKKKKPGEKVLKEIVFKKDWTLLFETLHFVWDFFRDLFNSIDYIGPLRKPPSRYYESIGETPDSVGPMGEFTSDILYQMKNKNQLTKLNKQFNSFDIGGSIDCECSNDAPGIFSIIKESDSSKLLINLTDNGFGVSQILPLITQGVWMEKERRIIIEQPEIHLNPKIQTQLGDFFIGLIDQNKNIILETHSEHIFLRIRTLIANGKKINSKKIGILFIEQDKNGSVIKPIPIDADGHIDKKDWPKRFFEDTLNESFRLAIEQSKRGKRDEVKSK